MKLLDQHDQHLIDDLTRVRDDGDWVVIDVAQIFWPSSSDPDVIWHPIKTLDKPCTAEQILRMRQQLLKRKTFFGLCELCQKRHAQGHMHNNRICQSCASDHLGVVY
jgi:hypothetical protein